jgi:hypothetical protein
MEASEENSKHIDLGGNDCGRGLEFKLSCNTKHRKSDTILC